MKILNLFVAAVVLYCYSPDGGGDSNTVNSEGYTLGGGGDSMRMLSKIKLGGGDS